MSNKINVSITDKEKMKKKRNRSTDDNFIHVIIDELSDIDTKTNHDVCDILNRLEYYLRDKWSELNYKPTHELDLNVLSSSICQRFEFLCSIKEVEKEWFGGVEQTNSPVSSIFLTLISISLILIAVTETPDETLAKLVNEALIKVDPTGAIFMYQLLENDERLLHTLLAYQKVNKMHSMTISFNTLFLIFLHQIFYKSGVIVDMFKHDLVIVPLMFHSLKHFTGKFNGFHADCISFKNVVSHYAPRLRHSWATKNCKLKSATLMIREALHETDGQTSANNVRMIRLRENVEQAEDDKINPLQGEFQFTFLIECFQNVANTLSKEKIKAEAIIKLLNKIVELLNAANKNSDVEY